MTMLASIEIYRFSLRLIPINKYYYYMSPTFAGNSSSVAPALNRIPFKHPLFFLCSVCGVCERRVCSIRCVRVRG